MSLVATGGGLIFRGDNNGRFKARDQETGEVLYARTGVTQCGMLVHGLLSGL